MPSAGTTQRPSTVVSNTSPLLNLAVIGQLDLVGDRFGDVLIPPAVHEELHVEEDRPGSSALASALEDGWLRIEKVQRERRLLALLENNLDHGESAALALPVEVGASRILLDERDGRKRARALDLPVTGVLGILLWAARQRKLASVEDVMRQLKEEAGFYIAPALEEKILRTLK